MKRLFYLCLVASFFFLLQRARAQEQADAAILERPRPAQGYYLSLGMHAGAVNARDAGTRVDPLGGVAGALHLGQSVTTWMDLGLAIEVGGVVAGDRTGSLMSFGVDWTLHPYREAFVRLGSAIGVNQLSAAPDSDDKANTFGALASITLGYGWFPWAKPRTSGGFGVSPVLRFSAVQPFTNNAAYWSMVGFEISWWSGLPKQQLDIPLSDAFARR